ncbi:MAG: 50S ribosomal protein L3 N(5)-glutamine methyltransferase [Gammaproteobacteria bacterium]
MSVKVDKQAVMSDLQTLRDLVRWGASLFNRSELFYGHGTDNAFDEALMLACHVLSLPPVLPQGYLESRLTCDERIAIAEIFELRIQTRKPAAYLTGTAWFAGLPFLVDERVLVPRSPLAEPVLQGFSPWLEPTSVERILDLCTGSGCIAVACAIAFDNASVHATDISEDALAVARHNIDQHGLEDWVTPIQSDLFDKLNGYRYQLIISNPPYVSQQEMLALPQEYHQEPGLGLQAEDEGLQIVIRILANAADYLDDDGILVVEVGNSQETLEERFPDVPFVWLDFENGGHGVFLLEAQQLNNYRRAFQAAL